jgi:hypothetical protein
MHISAGGTHTHTHRLHGQQINLPRLAPTPFRVFKLLQPFLVHLAQRRVRLALDHKAQNHMLITCACMHADRVVTLGH